MALPPGSRLGNFEILGLLGVGGMGEVYDARDTRLDRNVAIKVLAPEIAKDARLASRFEREARLLASLNHPHIAAIHDFQEAEGVPFLVMEKVEGPTLADQLAASPLSIEAMKDLFGQIAQALDFAHDRGVIHRDLKPANVKITPEGSVKLLDFGLAKALEPAQNDSKSEAPTLPLGSKPKDHTEEGTLLGTPAYMSPEQARGQAVDKRTDIWAFGCCLFEALTGERPFKGETRSDLLAEILKSEPNWERLPAETPSRIRDLLWRCLQKDPRRRLRDIGDAWFEISEAQSGISDAFPASPPSTQAWSMGRSGVVVIGLACLLFGGLAAALVMRTASDGAAPETSSPSADSASAKEVRRFSIALPWDEYLGDADSVRLAASPTGNHVAYVTESMSLYVRALDDEKWTPVRENTPTNLTPFFSPDGERLGIASVGSLETTDLKGDSAIRLSRGPVPVYRPYWADDGYVYYPPLPTGGVVRVPEGGGNPENVFTLTEFRDVGYWNPQPLPDGKGILANAWSYEEAGFSHRTVLLEPESGQVRDLIPNSAQSRYVPTGHIAFTRNGALMAIRFDLETGETRGAPVTLVNGVECGEAGVYGQYAFTKNGLLFYIPSDSVAKLVWVDMEGEIRDLPIPPGRFGAARVSPDGKRILIRLQRDEASRLGIYDIDREIIDYVSQDRFGSQAIWAPDGKEVFYDRFVDGQFEVVRLNPERSQTPVVVYTSPDLLAVHSISADGQWLAVQQWFPTDRARFFVRLVPTHGEGKIRGLSPPAGFDSKPRFSPNGEWVAYTRIDLSTGWNVYAEPVSGEGPRLRVSLGSGEDALWSPDGSRIYFRRGREMLAADVTWEPEVSFGEPYLLFEGIFALGGILLSNHDIHPDGDRFLMLAPGNEDPLGHRIVVVENWFEELKRLVP